MLGSGGFNHSEDSQREMPDVINGLPQRLSRLSRASLRIAGRRMTEADRFKEKPLYSLWRLRHQETGLNTERCMRSRRPDYPLNPLLLLGIAVALGTPTIVLVAWKLPEVVAIYTDWRVYPLGLARFTDTVALPFLLSYAACAILVGTIRSWIRKVVKPWHLVMLGGNVGALLCAFLVAYDQLPIDEMVVYPFEIPQ